MVVLSLLAGAIDASSAQGAHGPPPGYYASARNLTGPALRSELWRIVSAARRLSDTDLWSVVTLAERSEDAFVLTIYLNDVRPAGIHKNPEESAWEREHVWPTSRMPAAQSPCDTAAMDAHNVFASDPVYNRAKGNAVLDDCRGDGCERFSVHDRPGEFNKKGRHTAPDGGTVDTWEVWSERRGDAARAVLYMDLRYEGSTVNGCTDPDLILTDDLAPLVAGSDHHMGMACRVVSWHGQDPVDDRERRRNYVVYVSQQNRNPFIDHPEWVRAVWPQCFARLFLPAAGR